MSGKQGAFGHAMDITRSGSQSYTPEQAALVLRVFTGHVGHGGAIKVADLAARCNLDGRTVRQIVTDRDGEDYLLGGGDEGYYVATEADDADGLTNRLEATARTTLRRVERRRRYAAQFLPRRQPQLF